MEKRVILAFVLSFLILITWQTVFPSRQQNLGMDSMQMLDNKELVKKAQTASYDNLVSTPALPISKKEGERVVVNNGKIEAKLTTAGGVIESVKIVEYDAVLPVEDVFGVVAPFELNFVMTQSTGRDVVFEARQDQWRVRKKYHFSDEDFIVNAEIEVQNIGQNSAPFDFSLRAMTLNMGREEASSANQRDRNLLEYSHLIDGKVVRKTGAYRFTSKDNKIHQGAAQWIGFRNRYYSAIVSPTFPVIGVQTSSVTNDDKILFMDAILEKKVFLPGESLVFSSVIYFGPQKSAVLKKSGLFFEKIQVYFRSGFLDAIAKIIEDLMILMYKVVPNWGGAIILASLLIYFAMYPMTMKSMVSMRKMQSLQPKIIELRAKYEKNPQKLNQEIMKLYAENKVNPVGGCLPLLLQMPVFISLYQMIWRSILFKGANFLWIKDLSEPDRLFTLSRSFPVIGNEINLLPVVILVLMVIQQKITSKNMVITDPNQVMQQKMMTFMMPAVLLFAFYHIASGLTLYLTVFYLMSSFTQWKAAKTTTVAK